MADTNKIKYGIKNVYYAPATIGTNGSATYSTSVALPGAVNISLSQEGESSPFYADNIVYYTSISNNGYSGDLELAKIPDDFYKDILGYVADTSGVLVEDANAPAKHFALMFQFEGDAHAKRHVIYNCTAQRPDIAGSTKEASIEPQTETISINATSIYNATLNKDVVKASATPTESTAYNGWFTTVYQSS